MKNIPIDRIESTEAEKTILKELEQNRPFNARTDFLTSEKAREAVEVFHSLRRHIRNYSERALGSFIVSMTRNVTDLFTVFLLSREAGFSKMIEYSL